MTTPAFLQPGGRSDEIEPLDLMDVNLHADDPWPLYTWLREEQPMYQDTNGLWFFSRYDDIVRISLDPETFTSTQGNRPLLPNDESFIHMEGKGHTARRGLVQHLFTPPAIKKLETHIRDSVDLLIDGFIERGECEFVEDLSARLPMQLIGEMTGVPPEYWDEVRSWLDVFVQGGNGPDHVTEEVNEMFLRFGGLHMELVDQRREQPQDDLLSLWIAAMPGGEPMNDDQILWEHTMMTIGGSETSRNAMSGGIEALAQNPLQRDWLRDNLAGSPNAAEEAIRWSSPFVSMSRVVTQPASMYGKEMQPGDTVVMLYPPANRDPRKFDNADVFDIRRDFKNRSLAFGIGKHVCLGAHLARMQTKVVLEQMLKRLPDWELNGPVERTRSSFVRGVKTLPLRFTPGERIRS